MPQNDDTSGVRDAVVLRGVGKYTGDGFKDTTLKGEDVFVWNAELPPPYAPGQFPRIGCEGWTASTDQYDFSPATAEDVSVVRVLLTRTAHPPQAQSVVGLIAELRRELGPAVDDYPDLDTADVTLTYANWRDILAALQGQATGDRDGVEKRAFIAGYRAAHMVPDTYDSTSAAEEAWGGYCLVSDALTKGGPHD